MNLCFPTPERLQYIQHDCSYTLKFIQMYTFPMLATRTLAPCYKLLAMYPGRQNLKSRLRVAVIDLCASSLLGESSIISATNLTPTPFQRNRPLSDRRNVGLVPTTLKITGCLISGLLANNVGVSHDRTLIKTKYSQVHLLTPWSRVLLKKLTGSAASQEIPRIFGTRRFITVLTSARHLSLS